MSLAAFAFALAAFALLARSMRRHAGPGWSAWRSRTHRIAGWGLLLTSFAIRMADSAWQTDLVEWIGMLALCAAPVMLVLTYRPAWLRRIAPAALVIGLAAALLG